MLLKLDPGLRRRDDDGSVLVSVLIIMLVLTVGALVLSSMVVNTTGMLVGSRSTAQSRAAADAGLSDTIARAQRGEDVCTNSTYSSTSPRYTVSVMCDSGTVTFRAVGTGGSSGRTVTEASYSRNSTPRKLAGALVSAAGALNVSSLLVTAPAIDGDVVLNTGDFDCNNSMDISGDLIIRNGHAKLSNACNIRGDLIVSGYVQIDNNAVGVGGDVYTGGTFSLTTGATIKGNVYAVGDATISSGGKIDKSVTTRGKFTMDGAASRVKGSVWAAGALSVQNTFIDGNVISSSTSNAYVWNSTLGGLRVAGPIVKIQQSTVTHDVISASTSTSEIQAGVTIGGNLTLAGGRTGQPPTVAGTTTLNATGVVAPAAPSISAPWQMDASAFEWIDLGYNATAWGSYAYKTTPSCDFQGSYNQAHRDTINAYTTPTVVDMRGCANGRVNLYQATFHLKTDVVFLVGEAEAQDLTVTSADGNPHAFHIISPDNTADKAPTCTNSGWKINLYHVTMSDKISGIAYSPCTVAVGSGGGGRWNGQVYAGKITWSGNGTQMQLDYREVSVPGMVVSVGGGGGAATPSIIGGLVSLGDV
ncbi:polymer-forming cytoskeletal protein [Microbacterium sp. W1N]|uniref:polymer-forming cytoskeletal protein n=1 Tax=Microbacterium festucae TaxID=2977531 RepID=UPI0021C1B1E9|nr:polymer-forming cytoskeletal protein [Microbacterium festucae]MCT9821612.1 polymer-forming cytoskeletal protein [Microbacterium festucae]